ncbi:MAG: hypothetical protein CSA84_04680 [Actinomycetales bacterium]|nr:MAG: hypothetical protein CSA84_04680 [Actinomycetales bacterium]
MTGYSLHIGLNDVDHSAYPSDWDPWLPTCHNDANDMRDIAVSQGFLPTVMLDSQATSSAVLSAIAGLARKCGRGDIALITFAGHGGQVDDFNGDEPDHYDETWVLWDRQVTDDELHAVYRQFPAGSRIVVVSDSCHSGTVVRSKLSLAMRDAIIGIREEIGEEVVVEPGVPRAMPVGTAIRDARDRAEIYAMAQAIAGPRSTSLAAELILIAGCQDHQFAFEGETNGAFTGALKSVWDEGKFQGDYPQMVKRIASRMPSDQVPNYFTISASAGFQRQRPFTVADPAAGGSGPPPPAPPGGRPTLRQGSRGEDVRDLQQLLINHGYWLDVDGIFGGETARAVRDFQRSKGLTVDGVVGAQTWAALEGAGSPSHPTPDPTPPSTSSRRTIRRGDRGDDVLYLQQQLNSLGYRLSVDGIFGWVTESAVRSFQSSRGLTADGIVGPMTWAALG